MKTETLYKQFIVTTATALKIASLFWPLENINFDAKVFR